jgi:hypothetical protein
MLQKSLMVGPPSQTNPHIFARTLLLDNVQFYALCARAWVKCVYTTGVEISMCKLTELKHYMFTLASDRPYVRHVFRSIKSKQACYPAVNMWLGLVSDWFHDTRGGRELWKQTKCGAQVSLEENNQHDKHRQAEHVKEERGRHFSIGMSPAPCWRCNHRQLAAWSKRRHAAGVASSPR